MELKTFLANVSDIDLAVEFGTNDSVSKLNYTLVFGSRYNVGIGQTYMPTLVPRTLDFYDKGSIFGKTAERSTLWPTMYAMFEVSYIQSRKLN